MRTINISGVEFKTANPEPCFRLVQFGKGQPITCACKACAAKGQTPAEAFAAVSAAHGA